MKQLGEFKTTHAQVMVYDAEQNLLDTRIYVVKTITKRHELIRFGNAQQVLNIIETYHSGVMWSGENRNELNRLVNLLDRARRENSRW